MVAFEQQVPRQIPVAKWCISGDEEISGDRGRRSAAVQRRGDNPGANDLGVPFERKHYHERVKIETKSCQESFNELSAVTGMFLTLRMQ